MVMLSVVLRPALVAAMLAFGLTFGAGASPRALSGASAAGPHAAHAAASYLTGVADEQPEMFGDPLWRQLHTQISRYVVPYDAVGHRSSLAQATTWIRGAEAKHQQILIAFYHSEYTPTYMPTASQYSHFVTKFAKLFPHVRQYEPWDEDNRGNVRYEGETFNSPNPAQAAAYYVTLKRACKGCNILALDILDQPNVAPSLEYIATFKKLLSRWGVSTPTLWGLHNYSDTNRFTSARTRAILAVVPGQVWLTETGGVVKFGTDFSNFGGSGLTRAARALTYMFALASSNSRIKRLYIYQWLGSKASALFDAGLTDAHHRPRPGYVVVCQHMHAAKCHMKVSNQ